MAVVTRNAKGHLNSIASWAGDVSGYDTYKSALRDAEKLVKDGVNEIVCVVAEE